MKKEAAVRILKAHLGGKENEASNQILAHVSRQLRQAGFSPPFRIKKIAQVEIPDQELGIEGTFPATVDLVNIAPETFSGTLTIAYPNPSLQEPIDVQADDGNPIFEMKGIFQNVQPGQRMPSISGEAQIMSASDGGMRIEFTDTATRKIVFNFALPEDTTTDVIAPGEGFV